jgi:hypothetical protein
MAAPVNQTSQYQQIANAHSVELYNKAKAADDAYQTVLQYDFEGLGSMPSPINWTAPTGVIFTFDNSSGELQYASTVYSSLTSAQKREFFQYLPKFITVCMKAYDDNYSL